MKFLLVLLLPLSIYAQKNQTNSHHRDLITTNAVIKFYNDYAEDLRMRRREAIADRYDKRGYFKVGNGAKTYIPFEEVKKHYLIDWSGPKDFKWRDLSIEVLSPDAASITGLFVWQTTTGDSNTYSYSAVLVKNKGKWHIRVEDESLSPTGYSTSTLSGRPEGSGMYKFLLTAKAGAAISAHKHSSSMHITIKKGRKYILTGDLDTARVQRYETGSSFEIPANTWHVEWWEEETIEEIEMMAPSRTEKANPCTPRAAAQRITSFITVNKSILLQYVGEYQHPTNAARKYRIYLDNDTLKLSRNWDQYTSTLSAISEVEFATADGLYNSLRFSEITGGVATKLTTTAQCATYTASRIR